MNFRPEGVQCDLTVTVLRDCINLYKQKTMGVLPSTLLIHPNRLIDAYNVRRDTGMSAELLHIIPVPGWFEEDAWMLVGSEGYIIQEGA
jgi:hypothetical protein